jgi:hypothetical protein
MVIKVTTAGGRCYAHLVASFRNEPGQPSQRTIATLSHLKTGGQVDRLITAPQRAQGRPGESSGPAQWEFLEVRSAGDVWALWHPGT